MNADPVFLGLEGGWGLVEIQVMYKMHAYQYRVTHLLIFQTVYKWQSFMLTLVCNIHTLSKMINIRRHSKNAHD